MLCFNTLSNILLKLSVKSELKIFMFITEHLGPDWVSMAEFQTWCKADQVIRLDLDGWFSSPIYWIKRVCGQVIWPGHNTLLVNLEI